MVEMIDGDTPCVSSGHYSDHPPSPTPSRVSMIDYEDDEEEEDDEVGDEVKPIGNAVKVSCIAGSKRYHFNGFEARGVCYELEDTILVVPDEPYVNIKPSVAMIKDITMQDGRITVTGQRFYRLEVAVNENGEKWESSDSRELFYSFDKTEFPANAVMHKCRIHFIPPNKEIPRAKDQPGFIVRKVYDSKYKELTELVDTCYDDSKQHEIKFLLEKTTLTLQKSR